MAFSVTNLYNYCETTTTRTTITSGSLSIPAGSIIVVYASGPIGSPWAEANLRVTDSVDGVTGWNALANTAQYSGGTDKQGGQVFWKYFSGAVSRTITVDRGGGAGVDWFPGIDIVSVVGANTSTPIVQSASAFVSAPGSPEAISVTLGAAPTTGNCVLFFVGANNDGGGAASTPGGFSVLAAPSTAFTACAAFYHTATTAATITCADSGTSVASIVAAAVEILLAGAPAASGMMLWNGNSWEAAAVSRFWDGNSWEPTAQPAFP